MFVVAAVLIFAAGRWTADGGRFAQLEAEQRQLRDQVAAINGGSPMRTPPTAGNTPAPTSAGLKTGIDLVVSGRPAMGADAATVTLVEFSDFQCPFCGRYVRETLPQIKAAYVDTGKLRYVFRHYPIPSLHPEAVGSARAADCAQAQGRFWPMHDRLFANPRDHTAANLAEHAKAAGLTMSSYSTCMSAETRKVVAEDLEAGLGGGVGGTPAFFIGTSQPDGTMRVSVTVYGAKPYADFKAAIDRALAAAGS